MKVMILLAFVPTPSEGKFWRFCIRCHCFPTASSRENNRALLLSCRSLWGQVGLWHHSLGTSPTDGLSFTPLRPRACFPPGARDISQRHSNNSHSVCGGLDGTSSAQRCEHNAQHCRASTYVLYLGLSNTLAVQLVMLHAEAHESFWGFHLKWIADLHYTDL